MSESNKTQITKDLKERSLLVSREFNSNLENVWRAFTEKELLDQWWGPSPWRAETKTMNFKDGGYWLYAMVGPENEKHWARMNYIKINHHKDFMVEDAFADENGTINTALPVSKGTNTFTTTANGTRVDFKLIYESEEGLQAILEMGMAEGITICFDQLDLLLKK